MTKAIPPTLMRGGLTAAVLILTFVTGCRSEPAPPSNPYVSKTGFQAVSLTRPGEPQATYVLLDAWVDSPDHIITVSRRDGPSGVSYTRRRVDCKRSRLLTLGSGETVEAMMLERPDPHDSEMIGGSSATLTSVTACSKLGR